jgi:peptidyl-prolyl cis-trans isomerase A (cyclophilin A)
MKRVVILACGFAFAAATAAFAQGGGVDLSKAKLKTPAALTEKAPETFKAKFDTSKGAFVITVNRSWAPLGADRFYNLVKNGYYDDCRFFRALDGFMVQFGINGDPAISAAWSGARIMKDPVKQSNKKGFVSFAQAADPNTRTTQIFINLVDNARLDASNFSPFGDVTSGMSVVENLYTGYKSDPQNAVGRIFAEGNDFLTKQFPKLDYVKKATIEK